MKPCKQCGQPAAPRSNLCPDCLRKTTRAYEDQAIAAAAPLGVPGGPILLDCQACKTPGMMRATTAPRFSGVLRVIGFLIAAPSALGLFIAIVAAFTSATTGSAQIAKATTDAAAAGAATATGIGIMFSVIVGAGSLVGGVVGWLLLSNRKVYRCQRCGFILERA